MLLRLWTRVGQGNHVLDGGPDPPCEGAVSRGKKAAHGKVYGLSAVSCVKTVEPIEVPFGIWTRVGPRKHVLEVNVGASWRIRLNRPCAAAMRPFIKLLSRLVDLRAAAVATTGCSLWPPYVIGQATYIFSSCRLFFFFSFLP